MALRSIFALALLACVARADGTDESLAAEVDRYVAAAEAEKPKGWVGEASLGFAMTDGNSESMTLALALRAEREWDAWKLLLRENSIFSEADGDESANEHIFLERLERKLSERASLFQDLFLEHDEAEGLTSRLILTVGYARLLKKNEKIELTGEVGGGVLDENFRGGGDNTEPVAQVGALLKWQINKQLLFTQGVKLYPSLSEGGEFRLLSETTLSTPVGEKLTLKLVILDKYNSDPPTGIEENDLTITLNLVYKFS
jgi:putative salt-induced outer membrane protein